MTLIAGFRQRGTPMLIGDYLLTSNGRPFGARKKICRIALNFAVAWTGSLVVAEEVVTALRERFTHGPTLDDVRGYLTSLDLEATHGRHERSILLIGWVLGESNCCFLWNSQWPKEVFPGDTHFAGSGSHMIFQLALQGERTAGPKDLPGFDPVLEVLQSAIVLMMDEVGEQEHRAAGFGLGYEILYARHSSFQYVEDTSYFFAQSYFDGSGRHLRTEIVPRVFGNFVLGEFSVFQMHAFDQKPNLTRTDLLSPIFRVLPVDEERSFREMMKPGAIPSLGSYKALGIAMVMAADSASPWYAAPFVIAKGPDSPRGLFDVDFIPAGEAHDGQFRIETPSVPILEQVAQASLKARGTIYRDSPPRQEP